MAGVGEGFRGERTGRVYGGRTGYTIPVPWVSPAFQFDIDFFLIQKSYLMLIIVIQLK